MLKNVLTCPHSPTHGCLRGLKPYLDENHSNAPSSVSLVSFLNSCEFLFRAQFNFHMDLSPLIQWRPFGGASLATQSWRLRACVKNVYAMSVYCSQLFLSCHLCTGHKHEASLACFDFCGLTPRLLLFCVLCCFKETASVFVLKTLGSFRR